MPTLHLKLTGGWLHVEFHVDGEDLSTRLRHAFGRENPAEFPWDGLPWPGGDYKPADTVLGDEVRRAGAAGAILFACGCGYSMCGAVFADVSVTDATVTLSNFTTWMGGGKVVAATDPLVFDRAQFEEAVARLEREVEAWRPPPPKPRRLQSHR